MSVYEATIAKIQQMPEPLVYEVQDFVDFLLTRLPNDHRQSIEEVANLAEADITDYRANLEDYEDCLAHGEVRWKS